MVLLDGSTLRSAKPVWNKAVACVHTPPVSRMASVGVHATKAISDQVARHTGKARNGILVSNRRHDSGKPSCPENSAPIGAMSAADTTKQFTCSELNHIDACPVPRPR